MSENEDMVRILFDSVDASAAKRWLIVNDNVMGRVSKGEASPTEDSCLLFSGSISLENQGGFASIRNRPTDFDFGGFDGIRIRVKGDRRTYQLRLRRDRSLDGIACKHEFETTKNKWTHLELPFALFLPTFRGRTLTDLKPLDIADIRQPGFLISDKEAGPFKLAVYGIVACK